MAPKSTDSREKRPVFIRATGDSVVRNGVNVHNLKGLQRPPFSHYANHFQPPVSTVDNPRLTFDTRRKSFALRRRLQTDIKRAMKRTNHYRVEITVDEASIPVVVYFPFTNVVVEGSKTPPLFLHSGKLLFKSFICLSDIF